jgi:membrane-associated phospholipid phosphatase
MTSAGRRRLVSKSSVVLVLVAVAIVVPLAVLVRLRWALLQDADTSADDAVHRYVLAHPLVLDAARALTHLGDPLVVTAVTVAIALLLAVRRQWRAAAYALVVRAVATVLGFAVKTSVARARPDLPHPVATAHGQSFPSGHALGSAALWGSLAVLLASRLGRPWLVSIAVVVPLVVAATRVLLGVHFASDVVAGLALGWVVAVVTADLLRLRETDVPPSTDRSQA